MSADRKDGGPAFPHISVTGIVAPGMTLRQFYMGQIAEGDAAASNDDGDTGWGHNEKVTDTMIKMRVKLYRRIADAIIEESNRP